MRIILNLSLAMPTTGTDSVNVSPARERLFQLGEAPRSASGRERWSWALLIAALAHVGVVAVGMSRPAAARPPAAPREEPELVFMHLAPPPALAASAPHAVHAERVKSRPRTLPPRPLVPRVLQEQPLEKPIEPEPFVPEQAEDASDEAPVQERAPESAGLGDSLAGVLGGVLDGREGVLVGAMGGALDLKQVAQAPRVLQQVRPRYPRSARSEGIEGLVLVRVIIGVDGYIEPGSTQVVRSVAALDAAALSAVSQWRFSPALGPQGRPVRVIVEIPVQFSLK